MYARIFGVCCHSHIGKKFIIVLLSFFLSFFLSLSRQKIETTLAHFKCRIEREISGRVTLQSKIKNKKVKK
jgi:hypothetical protein